MQFKIAKILDQGTDNPIVNRIFLQFSYLAKGGFFWREEDKQKQFSDLLFNLMTSLLKVENAYKEYLKIEEKSIQNINSVNGVKYQKNGFAYDDPTLVLQERFEEFLIKAVVSIRKFTNICTYVLDKRFSSHKSFHKFFLTNLKEGSKFHSWFENGGQIVKEIYDLRALVEHEDLKVDKFDVKIKGDKILIIQPKIFKIDHTLKDYMDESNKFLFTYFETVIAQLLSIIYRGPGKIVELEENQMKSDNFRYIIDFNLN
ncbi:MAG: hypothetical protein V3V16_12885 [Melioribacteraceae bacterium]